MKTNIKIIIGVVIGILISVGSCYVLAETLINSKDVVYEDNSELVADNVQDAIDGTCSKIDTRLSDIEDKLYLFKNFNATKEITTTTTLSYTGISLELPANSYCAVTGRVILGDCKPLEVRLTYSETDVFRDLAFATYTTNEYTWYQSIWWNGYTDTGSTVYLWAKYDKVCKNTPNIYGWCATKYK